MCKESFRRAVVNIDALSVQQKRNLEYSRVITALKTVDKSHSDSPIGQKKKRPVYNGYTEIYLTGKQMNELFKDEYYISDRYRTAILGITIPEYFTYLKIDDEKTYRLFVNYNCCQILKADTDGKIAFFGHTPLEYLIPTNIGLKFLEGIKQNKVCEELWLPSECPECGAPMDFKCGRYGEFLGCSNYPNCGFTKKIMIIGNLV